ncbi:MAG TPA: endonuclease III [Bacteroides sp.]|nr:endonuclease III [Bacteroides sp.]
MKKKERYEQVIQYFNHTMPVAETELLYGNPYELIVAVILSAQCTDKRVNMITPLFFQHFPDACSLAASEQDAVFQVIKSCSYPNSKAKNLLGMAKMLVEKFGGTVPDNMDDLLQLPGVGRKTANVILSVAFRKPAMAVDTHVFRVSTRIGLVSNAKNPYQAEMQLVKNIPAEQIHIAHHWLILHGRYVCKARNPECHSCGLRPFCLYYKKNHTT